MLFVDAGNDRVGIGTSTPGSVKLEVAGSVAFRNEATQKHAFTSADNIGEMTVTSFVLLLIKLFTTLQLLAGDILSSLQVPKKCASTVRGGWLLVAPTRADLLCVLMQHQALTDL